MRIRKNAKIFSQICAAASLKPETILQPRACVLNQNPWDTMDFSPPSSPLPPTPPQSPSPCQDETVAFPENGGFVGANETTVSVAPVKIPSDDEDLESEYAGCVAGGAAAANRPEDGPVPSGKAEEPEIMLCCKTDGKLWRCKNKAAEGNTMCEHHLIMIRSYTSPAHLVAKKSKKEKPVVPEKEKADVGEARRRHRAKKASSGSNPYEFYYYSGFGPRWGKRRGETRRSSKDDRQETDRTETPELSPIDIQAFEYMDDEEDEEEVKNNDSRRKKARKPVKARSLKSLM